MVIKCTIKLDIRYLNFNKHSFFPEIVFDIFKVTIFQVMLHKILRRLLYHVWFVPK